MKLAKKTATIFLSIVLLLGLIPQTVFAYDNVTPVTENNSFVKTEFFKENPLGIAGNFHLVGFNSVETKAHVNGNILTKLLKYKSNFGTTGVKEVSYFQNLEKPVNGLKSTYGGNNSVLVVGNSIEIGMADNGNSWTLNGGKVVAPLKVQFPNNLWQDTEVKFVDIDSVKEEIIAINQKLHNYGDIGTEIHLEDMNNQYINISNPADVNYCNLQADSLRTNSPVAVKGFVKGEKGTLVINVDLKGKSSFSFSGSDIYYTDGTKAPNGEVTSWQDGNVIWNFWDSSDTEGMYRGTINNLRATAGHIIAPEATVDLTQNFNGTAIAENIIASAETHRTDFTGKTIYPEPEVGNLTVSKTVAGNAGEKDRDFTFKVTLSDTSVNGEYGDMTFKDGVATFTLKHGENKTATGLPAGITYIVAEDDYSSEGYVTSKENDTGTVEKDKTATVGFVNTKEETVPDPEPEVGNLTVSKTVAGNAGEKDRDFTFKVTLSDTSVNGEYGDMTFKDGVATFTLKHGENKTATGLPAGITYIVAEDDYSSEGYVTSKENDTGTVEKDKESEAKFINKKDITSHSEKNPSGDNIESPKTGDRTNLALYISLLIISGTLMVFGRIRRKKIRECHND